MSLHLAVTRPALSVDAVVEMLQLRAPFRISGYTFSESPVAVVTVQQGEVYGRGEAAGVYYLSDDPDGICATVAAHRDRIEAGLTRYELLTLLPPGGARNALDCALWELESRQLRQPVWRLAGLDRVVPRITTFTLSADDPARVAAAAVAFTEARSLKLKLTGDIDADVERVRAVRRARPDVWLGVDANQGYTASALSSLLPALVTARVQLLEQPVARGQEAWLDDFDSPIPLAADESVQELADLEAQASRFDVVNIKLDKCGGLTAALRMVEQVRHLGLTPMVGTMLGTSLAMAPAFVLAQYCDFVDLDAPIILTQDRSPGVLYQDGTVWCPENSWGAAAAES